MDLDLLNHNLGLQVKEKEVDQLTKYLNEHSENKIYVQIK
jgi:hypothetical protein